MEQNPYDLAGMDVVGAKEYIGRFIATLHLTEKEIEKLQSESRKWEGRIQLAHDRGEQNLAMEAEKEAQRIKTQLERLTIEAAELRSGIDRMKRQVPGLEARRRTVDPDLLEQELIMATGSLPGDEKKIETERRLEELQKEHEAETALEALKRSLGIQTQADSPCEPHPEGTKQE